MFWLIIIFIIAALFCFGFCKGLGHYRSDEQKRVDDEAQIKFLEEWRETQKGRKQRTL